MGKKIIKVAQLNNSCIFVNREKERKLFWDTYDSLQLGESDVISFYGDGGCGKSSLLHELEKEMRLKKKEGKSDFVYFSLEENSSKEVIIKALMASLKEFDKKLSFPLVNAAMEKIESTSKMPIANYQKTNGFFQSGDISDFAGFGAGITSLIPYVGPIVAPFVQVGGFAIKKRLEMTTRRKYKKRGKEAFFTAIKERDRKYSLDMLQTFFIEDVWQAFENRETPLVVFIDGYDEYVNRGRDGISADFQDEWVYDDQNGLINLPNTLWVFSGRNKLIWWPEYYQSEERSCEIHNFSRQYSDELLTQSGITSAELQRFLFELTNGTPIYLDLCIRTYRGIKQIENREPIEDDFGQNSKELVFKFVKNLYPEAQKVLFMISCMPQVWKKDFAIDIAKILGYGDICGTLEDLLTLSMFEENYGLYRLHATVREVIRDNCIDSEKIEEVVIKKALEHIFLCESFEEQREWIIYLRESLIRCKKQIIESNDIENLIKVLVMAFNANYDYQNYEKCIVPIISYIERNEMPWETLIYARNMRGINLSNLAYYKEMLSYSKDTYELALEKLGEKNYQAIVSLDVVSSAYMYMKDFDLALEHYNKYLTIFSEVYGTDNGAFVEALCNISSIYYHLGKYDMANSQLTPCYELMRRNYGPENEKTLICMNSLGSIKLELGDFDGALSLLQDCYRIKEENGAQRDTVALMALNNIGKVYFEMGEYDKATKAWEDCYEEKKESLGEDNILTADSLFNLGKVYKEKGEYSKAQDAFSRSYERVKEEFGEDNIVALTIMTNIAEIHSELHEYDDAAPIWEKCCDIGKTFHFFDDKELVNYFYNCGVAYYHSHNFIKAQNAFEQSYELSQITRGEDCQETIDILNVLGQCFLDAEQYDKAATTWSKYVQYIEKKHGELDLQVIITLRKIALLYEQLNDNTKAIEIVKELLKREKALYGETSVEVMNSLVKLANCYDKTRDYQAVVDVLLETYAVALVLFEGNSDEVEKIVIEIYYCYKDLNDIDKAVEVKRQYYELIKSRYGLGDLKVGSTAAMLIIEYQKMGALNEAYSICQELLDYVEKTYGPNNDLTKEIKKQKAGIEKEMKKG